LQSVLEWRGWNWSWIEYRNFLHFIIMKKLLLSLILVLAGAAVAQTAKKNQSGPPPQPAKSIVGASAPKLTTKEPSFAGFTGSFFKFGNVSGANRPFTMSIEYKPWFFEVSGLANAGHNTEDLDILLEDIIGVLAYYDAQGKAPDGTDYQAGLFDFMVYLDDKSIKVSNLKIELKGKATQGSTVLGQAKTWNFEPGSVFKATKYSNEIVKAQAKAMDISDIEKEEAAAKKRVKDSIAAEKKRVDDSIAKEKKRVKDSIAAEKQRVDDSIAKEKKRVAKEKKRIADSIADAEELKKEEKRKAAAAKKKKQEEEDEAPVKKKKKKKSSEE